MTIGLPASDFRYAEGQIIEDMARKPCDRQR
jgi:hypothetical protein